MQRINVQRGRNEQPFISHRPLTLAVAAAYIVMLGILAYLALKFEFLPGELQVAIWVQSWRTPWLDTIMEAISIPGRLHIIAVPIVGLTAALLFFKGLRKEGGLLIVTTALASVFTNVLKDVVARPRPTADVLEIYHGHSNFSFPSGHVTTYVVFLGMLLIILTWNMRPCIVRRLMQVGLALGIIGVGISRVYLGAHFPSDVVAGYAFGAAMVAVVVVLGQPWARTRRRKYATEARIQLSTQFPV